MNDLLLCTQTKKVHMEKLEDSMKELLNKQIKNISQIMLAFRKELQYNRNTIFNKDRRVCVKVLRGRSEAIQKLKPLTTSKSCRGFAGIINFLILFCSELQKYIKTNIGCNKEG